MLTIRLTYRDESFTHLAVKKAKVVVASCTKRMLGDKKLFCYEDIWLVLILYTAGHPQFLRFSKPEEPPYDQLSPFLAVNRKATR